MNPSTTVKKLKKSSRVAIALLFCCLSSQVFAQTYDSRLDIKDTVCSCKPSLPLEIAATSIIWGMPIYWAYRGSYPKDSTQVTSAGIVILPSLFLLMISLGPIAEWTSGCEASWWHTLWIGLGTSLITGLAYGSIYGFKHPVSYQDFKFKVIDYLALGVLPSVGSCLIYNLFLHPSQKKDQGFYLYPSVDGKNTASLNFMMQF